VNIKKKKSNHI